VDSRAYWVGFNLVKGIGAVRMRALLNYFGDLSVAWQAPMDALRSCGMPPKTLENFLRVRRDVDLDKLWQKIQMQGINVITWEDELYPRRLKEIDQPPPVLYLRGTLKLEDEWAVAIVGTRRMTAYGKQVAEELAEALAQHGVTVISGLARGVDGVAHQAALRAGGRTLAVLGSGVDCIYPPEHRKLAEQIIQHGGLLSDYPPGSPPDSINFPPRNRIISGMSTVTVVVEAGESSGALITATFAAEQGREVFAVPGNIYAPQCKGTNRLIQQGARPLLTVDEVLETLNVEQVHEHRSARLMFPMDAVESALLQTLGSETMHVDEILAQSGLSIDKVSATLAMMELKGLVRHLGGMNYTAVHETSPGYRMAEHD
jgi:DNA processing protein